MFLLPILDTTQMLSGIHTEIIFKQFKLGGLRGKNVKEMITEKNKPLI